MVRADKNHEVTMPAKSEISMGQKLGWGILGAGRIAEAFSRGVAASRTGRLAAVVESVVAARG